MIEAIEKGLPTEIQVLVKVPHWTVDQGTVYWKKQVNKELFIPLVNLLEGGIEKVNLKKVDIETQLRETLSAYNTLVEEHKNIVDELDKLKKQVEKSKEIKKDLQEKIKQL